MCGWAVAVNHLGVKTPLAEVVELGGTGTVLFLGTCSWIQVQLRTCCLGLTVSLYNFNLCGSFLHLCKKTSPQPHSLQRRQARAVVSLLLVPLFSLLPWWNWTLENHLLKSHFFLSLIHQAAFLKTLSRWTFPVSKESGSWDDSVWQLPRCTVPSITAVVPFWDATSRIPLASQPPTLLCWTWQEEWSFQAMPDGHFQGRVKNTWAAVLLFIHLGPFPV